LQRDDEQMAAFRQFVTQEGESLYWQAAFDALHAYQVKEDEMRWGWPVWPEAYQTVDTPEVKAFCKNMLMKWISYLWLQWLAYSQFAACWQVSQGYKMPIGLYRDLAAWQKAGRKPGVTASFTA
jgi:4-alpha-glucanotransferase